MYAHMLLGKTQFWMSARPKPCEDTVKYVTHAGGDQPLCKVNDQPLFGMVKHMGIYHI